MSPQFSKRFKADIERPGHCDLMINYVEVTNAGTYECLSHIPSPVRPDRIKPYVVSVIQLTVMGKNFLFSIVWDCVKMQRMLDLV